MTQLQSFRFFFFLLVASSTFFDKLQAQEFSLSISGNTSSTISGITRPYFDYWVKPNSDAGSAAIRIFDAGISSRSGDVIYGKVDTKTSYTLYRFSELYSLENQTLIPKLNSTAKEIVSITISDEEQYRNRWEFFSEVKARDSLHTDSLGYIVRVSAFDGNDVNAFKLTVTELSEFSSQSSRWELIAIDLSMGTINLSLSDEIQLNPVFDSQPPPRMSIVGEERANVVLKDDFGNSSPLGEEKLFWKPIIAGVANHWGLSISRSLKYNFFTVVGVDNPVLWNLRVNVAKIQTPPLVDIIQSAGNACDEIRLSIGDKTFAQRLVKKPVWITTINGSEKRVEGDTALIAFGKPGIFSAELWIHSQGIFFPKIWVKSFEIKVNEPPVAKISVDKMIIAPKETVVFSAENSFDTDGGKLRYEWFVDGAIRSTESRFRFSNDAPNRYKVVLRVIDDAINSACITATDTAYIVVNSQPYAEIDYYPEFSLDEVVTFNAVNNRDNDGDSLQYQWSGVGIISNENQDSIQVSHDRQGIYAVSLRVSDFAGVKNSSYKTSAKYRVNAPPVPRFSLPKLSAPNDIIRVSASLSNDLDDRALYYLWEVSDGQEFHERDITLQFEQPGDYTVTLTIDDGHGTSNSIQSLSRSIHINFPPDPKIDALEVSTIAKQTFSAKNTIDGDDSTLIYTWNFGDGFRANGKEVTHTYKKSGRYPITLTVNDGKRLSNSIQAVTREFRLIRYPTAKFESIALAEPNKPIFLDGRKSVAPDAAIAASTWYVDGVEAAKGDTVSIVIEEPGDHTIVLRVQNDTGFEDAQSIQSKKIHLNFPPVPKWASSRGTATVGEVVTFDATRSYDKDGKIKKYSWQFSDSTILYGAKVKKTFTAAGVQTVELTVDDGLGFDNSKQSVQGQILINSSPILITNTVIRSNSRRVFLDASKSYDIDKQTLSFEWLMPDGSIHKESSFYWEAPSEGVHFISLTIHDGQNLANSQAHETIKILINRSPVPVLDSVVIACTGQTILFNGSRCLDPDGDALKFHWDFGDGKTSTETDPAHVYSKPGRYSVVLKLDDGFITEPILATIPVLIGGSPLAIHSFYDTTICVQSVLHFDGGKSFSPVGTIGSYSWDFGDGETALGQKVLHSFSKEGIYSVALTVVGTEGIARQGQCSNVSQSTATVRVVSGPIAAFSFDPWIAMNDTAVFDASLSKSSDQILSATWRIEGDTLKEGDSDHMTRSGLRISHVFKKAGVYPITLSITTDSKAYCKSATITQFIRVNQPPTLNASVPGSVAIGEQFILDASPSFDHDGIVLNYEWKLDGKLIGKTPKLFYTLNTPGEHRLEITITDDSPTRTKSVNKVFTVFANAAPKPSIELISPLYVGESIALIPKPYQDENRDTIRFRWFVNGKSYTNDSISFLAGNHTIKLIADDQRGLINSLDSVQVDIEVLPAPSFPSSLPKHIVQGTAIDMQKLFESTFIGFINDNTISPSFQASQLGKNDVRLGWKPRNKILKVETYDMVVWEPLKFLEAPKPKTMVWNPANPTTIVSAPKVNRPDNHKVIYKWVKGKTVVGYGQTIEVALKRGENIFTVEASEENLEGAVAIEETVIIQSE